MTNATCSAPECEKPPLCRGMCVTHYHRWNRATKEQRPEKGTCEGCGATLRALKKFCGPDCRPRCAVDGCEKPVHGKTYCATHHARWKRRGDPLAPLLRQPNEGTCSVTDCDQPMRKTGLCASHYAMKREHGEIRDWKYRWGDGGYVPTHNLLRRERGKASEHACVDCGNPADEWSYDGGDPAERTDERGRAFTRNLAAYSPRCFRCHRIYDENPIAVRKSP